MLKIQFVNSSPYRVILPREQDKQAILTLAQAFTTYENGLSIPERTPLTGMIEIILEQALAVQAESQTAEAERKAASEAAKRLDAAASTAVRQIRLMLGAQFVQTPERAQAWGFIVRQTGTRAGSILIPIGRDEIGTCLNRYVMTEQARDVTEQFTLPALSDIVALRDDVQEQWQNRIHAGQRRLQANAQLDKLCQQLSDHLRRALSYLVMVKFDGQGDRQLGEWGFKIVNRTPASPTAPEAQPEAAP